MAINNLNHGFMKNIFLILCILLSAVQLEAQRSQPAKIKITGKVIDKDTRDPLPYATITLQHTRRKQLLTGAITNEKGTFETEAFPGTYDIKVEYISFKSVEVKNRELRKNTDLGVFSLELNVEALDEVDVIAEKSTVEIRLDKKVFNVGKDITSLGGSASDVLDNVPSVSVDVEGNVSLRGNDNVRILINGKPSALVGLNGTDALRQLPAESIEKVEVITSPSARYDAEGTAGILNIILRNSKLKGLNGSINASLGEPFRAGLNLNLNYRTKKFNFFTNTGYSHREGPGSSFNDTEYLNGNAPSTFTTEDRSFDRLRKGFNTNLGVEYFINNSATLTTSIIYREGDNENEAINNIFNYNDSRELLSQTRRIDPEFEDNRTLQFSVNFTKDFKNDAKLTLDFQHEDSTEDEQSVVSNTSVFPTTELLGRETVGTREDQSRILLQADYVLPIGENAQFEAGYRGNFREQLTEYEVTLENDQGIFVRDNGLSNVLNYREYVNAAYTQFGNKLGKFSYLAGLRMENSQITIQQITSGELVKKNYTDLFPTLNLTYELGENENISLGFNRRIRRPRSRFINPFPSRSSISNIFQGNPDIDPSYSNAFDIGYLKRWQKFTFNGSVYYQKETQSFTFITDETDEIAVISEDPLVEVPVLRRFPINLSKNNRYGLEFTLSYNPSRKLRLNGNFNLFSSEVRGDYEETNFDANNTSWFARFNSIYTLPGKINWQTRLFYRGPYKNAQSDTEGILSVNLGFSKDFFKEKATLSLNVSDLFNSRKRSSDSELFRDGVLTTVTHSEFQWRQRSFGLNFIYRFNQKKNEGRRNRQRQDGGDDFELEGR